MDQREQQHLPGEVVLEYSQAPRGIVLEYRQAEPLPGLPDGAEPPLPEEDGAACSRKKRKRQTLAFFLAFLLLCAGAAGIHFAYRTGWLTSLEPGGPQPSQPEQEMALTPSLPTVKAEADAKMTIHRSHGPTLTPQEIYAQVNPATVTVFCGSENGVGQVGTGVIFTPNGYVLTNYHVIDSGSHCYVLLESGLSYEAHLVAGDYASDIAVLKLLGAEDLPTVEFGDSDALVVGDPAYAIGNPLGLELQGTLTDGIISATSREVSIGGRTLSVMQTNAALNSGNSGGPLINQYGQVVGINTIKMMSTVTHGSVEGLGFALPSTSVIYVVNDLLRFGYSRGEPSFGMMVYNALTPLPDGQQGLEIQSVNPGSCAEAAGLRPGDFILQVDGQSVARTEEIIRLRRTHAVGDRMVFTVWRDGQQLQLELTLSVAAKN